MIRSYPGYELSIFRTIEPFGAGCTNDLFIRGCSWSLVVIRKFNKNTELPCLVRLPKSLKAGSSAPRLPRKKIRFTEFPFPSSSAAKLPAFKDLYELFEFLSKKNKKI